MSAVSSSTQRENDFATSLDVWAPAKHQEEYTVGPLFLHTVQAALTEVATMSPEKCGRANLHSGMDIRKKMVVGAVLVAVCSGCA